jgi:hypothetical protein
MGAGAISRGVARQNVRRQEDLERRRVAVEERQQTERELDGVIERRRSAMAADDLDFAAKLRRDEMQRYLEAEGAWNKFEAAVGTIDMGSPTAPQQYKAISQSYIGQIAKHDAVRKKWEAFDKVTQQNTRFQAQKLTQQSVTAGMLEAARIAPGLNINPPKTPDGEIDALAFETALEAAREKRLQQAIRLREATAGGKKRTTEPAEVSMDRRLLQKVRGDLTDLSVKGARDPSSPASTQLADQYRRLQDEERRILHRIQRGLAMAPPDAGGGEAEPAGGQRQAVSGFDPEDPLGLGNPNAEEPVE